MTAKNNPAHELSQKVLSAWSAPNTVYVREVSVRELKAEGTLPIAAVVPKGLRFWALHTEDGTRVAIVDDRAAAFDVAREHDLAPLSVH